MLSLIGDAKLMFFIEYPYILRIFLCRDFLGRARGGEPAHAAKRHGTENAHLIRARDGFDSMGDDSREAIMGVAGSNGISGGSQPGQGNRMLSMAVSWSGVKGGAAVAARLSSSWATELTPTITDVTCSRARSHDSDIWANVWSRSWAI